MSNYDDRGAYSPRNEEPLAFDARYPRGGERRPPPTALILSAVVLILLAAGVFFYYRSGIRSEGQAPRVVGEPVGEMVSPPPASSQPADPTDGLEIYNTNEAPTAQPAPTFAPDPEVPVARPAPAPARPAPTAPVEAAPLRPAAKPAPVEARPAPAAKPAPPVAKPAVAPAKPKPVAETPAPAKPAPAAAKPAAETPKPAAAAGGPAVVQIGAFSSSSQANKGWNDVARILPGDMAGRGKRIEQADVGGSTFHRTYVTGFASKTDAQAFCGKLKAAGKSCIVR
jgi:cell division protein FtsN